MSVFDATERELAELRKRAPDLADSSVAAMALAMAQEIDNAGNSATSKSMCARSLLEAMNQLRDLAPAKQTKDGIDELAAQRAARRSGVAGA